MMPDMTARVAIGTLFEAGQKETHEGNEEMTANLFDGFLPPNTLKGRS
jgi:hypothetical protein